MRIRSPLSLAAAAVAAVALTAPRAGAADNGIYEIRDANLGGCVAPDGNLPGAHLETCSDTTQWVLTNRSDGTVILATASDPGRCLGLFPILTAPAQVRVARCGAYPDRWRVDGPDGLPSALSLADQPGTGSLTTAEGPGIVTLGGDGDREWVVQRVA